MFPVMKIFMSDALHDINHCDGGRKDTNTLEGMVHYVVIAILYFNFFSTYIL